MRTNVRLTGFRELEQELAKLSKGMGRGALRRAGMAALMPMAQIAAENAPRDEGELAGSIMVGAKAKGGGAAVGRAEFAAVMRSGGGKQAAVAAMRDARRAAHGDSGPPSIELFMGPSEATSRKDAIKRIVQEFGSEHQPGTPYMRPAWEQDHMAMLARLKHDLWREVRAAVARAEARAAREAVRIAARA